MASNDRKKRAKDSRLRGKDRSGKDSPELGGGELGAEDLPDLRTAIAEGEESYAMDSPAFRVKLLHSPVLVLNLNYVPLNICTVRRAVVLVGKGKAELLENHRGQVRTVDKLVDVPSIIRLVYLVKKPFLPRKLSKKEVFLRDRFTCQYCGKKSQDLTLDHVVPRRQFGAHTWENVVAACSRCNLRKAGRTPVEAGMLLERQPRAPDPNPYLILQNRTILEEWRPYIPWSAVA